MLNWGRFVGAVTAFINRIVCLALSILLLILAARPELFLDARGEGRGPIFAEDLADARVWLLAAGGLWLVLNLNLIQFLLYSIWNHDVRRYIYSKTATGTARVSLDAIDRSLQAATKGMPEIARCKLRVYRIGAKRYKVEVRYWIPEDCNVLNINEKLRLILKKRFSELVSLQPDDRVFFDISLAGFKGRRGRAIRLAGGAPRDGIEATSRQFKGPVYPIDGEA